MSKVFDNNIERDATQQETADISKKGGGTGRFELIQSGTIEDTIRKAITIGNYDEVYIVLENLTGSGTLVAQIQVETTTTTTTRLTNFLTSTAKYLKCKVERLIPSDFYITYNGTGINTTPQISPLVTSEGITYDHKIQKVVIACSGEDSVISTCTYKIYGRNQINE